MSWVARLVYLWVVRKYGEATAEWVFAKPQTEPQRAATGVSTLKVHCHGNQQYNAAMMLLTRDARGNLMLTFVAGRETKVVPVDTIEKIELVK